jgi:aryl-alcohol dehydrogenase-like predicted oxidoreductase
MDMNPLGNSGLVVSDLCLGTMIFGEDSDRSTPPDAAKNIIHRYLDAGGNHVDTANVYADGRSEEIVGEALSDRRTEVVLATKVRFPRGDGANEQGLSRQHIMQEVHASLRRLDTDWIDLLYMHCWDPVTPLAESLRAFDDLVRQGKVRYIGVSNFKAWHLMKALGLSDANGWARFVAGQYQYSLVKRDIEYEFLDLCQNEGVGLTPWSPLGGGFLTGKYSPDDRPSDPSEGRIAVMGDEAEEAWHRRNTERNWDILEAVDSIARARDATQAQIALAWLRDREAVSSIILGVRTMAQLEENLGAATIELTDAERNQLDEASALPERYPYRFIEDYGARDVMAFGD